jgi:hypothetical protein
MTLSIPVLRPKQALKGYRMQEAYLHITRENLSKILSTEAEKQKFLKWLNELSACMEQTND